MSKFTRAITERLFRKTWDGWRTAISLGVQPGMGGVVFLGDSLTHMGRWELMFPRTLVRNLGIGGERTEHILKRLEPVVQIRPEKLFLLIGTNDLASGLTVNEIASNVAQILDQLARDLPSCKLHLQSALPRQKKYAERIKALNAEYQAIAAKRGIAYIDLYTRLDDGNGELKSECTYDRLHLSGPGYLIWRDVLRPHVEGSAA